MLVKVVFYLYVIIAFSVPIFWIYKLIQSFFGKSGIFISKKFILNNEKVEVFYSFIVIALSSFNLLCISGLVDTGKPLQISKQLYSIILSAYINLCCIFYFRIISVFYIDKFQWKNGTFTLCHKL